MKPSEETLFEALSQVPLPERAARLREACGQDDELRERLHVLLAAHDRGGQFMAQPVAPAVTQSSSLAIPLAERLGDQIGAYKLIQQIGEGGCGVVYMAQQEKPVRRLVALKIIKLGMDTRQVVARFEAERQVLALMDHPNIAKVLDAGATQTGRPFFVMELVRGIKITDYCDQNQLSTTERLELFIQVCRAVQHAHQKGIIHRDLKPSNILVTINDGVPVPKVIDFGIAKATQGHLTDMTVVTAFDQFIGTPAYVSPEQAVLTSLDIDTRSDIYSLGVLLYELLTGKTPFDTQQLLAAGLDELRRTIREQQPLRPSTRLSTLGEVDLTTVAKARHAEPARLKSLLRGDLDWIVMKCLEKDRTRRYETANGLARDLERHLRHEPVAARPPSGLYEFQKTVQRHWVGFAAVAAVLAALAVGVVVSTFEAVRARRAEQHAITSGASEARARALAEQRLYEAKISEARAKRLSGVAGQRFESLAAITEAAGIRRLRDLRDEAIACLALTDLRVQKTFKVPSRWSAEGVEFDDQLDMYAYETDGGISVRRAANGQETAFLPFKEASAALTALISLRFDHLSRHLAALRWRDVGEKHLYLWDLNRGGALALDIIGNCFAFSPDNQRLGIAKGDGTVSILELSSLAELKRFNIGARLTEFYFDPTGARIAGFEDGGSTAWIWDAASGRLLVTLLSSAQIYTMAWNQDGSLLALGGLAGGIELWDVRRGELHLRLEGHYGGVAALAFDHEGQLLASSSWDGTIRLWNLASGQQVVVYPSGAATLRFSPDDRTLGCAFDGAQCHLLEVAHPMGYRRLTCLAGRPESLALDFSPDGRVAATAGAGGVWLLDVSAGRELGSVSEVYSPSLLFSAATGSSLWSATDTGLYRWSVRFDSRANRSFVQVKAPERVLPHERLEAFVFDRAEKRVAATRSDGVLLLDLEHATEPAKFCVHPHVKFMTMDAAGRWVATGTWKDDGVKVWEFSTGRLLRTLPVSGSANVTFSPDGNWLATANNSAYRLWDTRSWSPAPQSLPGDPIKLIGQMAFSPDGRLLATCHDTRQIQIVQVPTLHLVARLVSPLGMNINLLRFSPDGSKLAALESTGVIHLWSLSVIWSELKKLNLDWDLPPFAAASDLPSASGPALVLDAGPFSRQELDESIPARDTKAPANLIDLTEYYNAPLTASWHSLPEAHNDLSEMPHSLQTFAGVRFDVRGLIQIATRGDTGLSYPGHIYSIPIGQSCQRLHFLYSAIRAAGARDGDELGSYVIHYIDGHQVIIPIVVGRDVADWWSQPNEENMKFVIAWTGENSEVRKFGGKIRLFKTTWENPYPGVPVRQFDFVCEKGAPGAPFLVALTAEP